MKVLTTSQLINANDQSIKRRHNKNLKRDSLKNLDPNGMHLCTMPFLHGEGPGEKPHVRCMMMMKVSGQSLPAEELLDVPVEIFNAAADAPKP